MRKSGTAARRYWTRCAAVALVAASIGQAAAQPVEQSYALEAQNLSAALTEVARISGAEIVAPADILAGLTTRRLSGIMTAAEAVDRLLAETGLRAERLDGAFIIRRDIGRDGDRDGRIAKDDGLITVTGSRIRGSEPVGSSVITLKREAIEKSGYATVQQLLQSIPQNFSGGPGESTASISARGNASLNPSYGTGVNLRGLGSSSTLVLLNGNRPPLGGFSGVFTDVSLIPVSAVERIEVLADGASAIYGSDAVAGVVNVVPRTRFEGIEATARFGTANGDFSEIQAGGIVGHAWSTGRAVVAYEYNERGRLAASERNFATEDLRRFGGPDYRRAYASPGTIIAGGRTFAIPSGQNGVGLTSGQLLADMSNPGDGWANTDILPDQKRHALYGRVSQEFGGDFEAYAEALFAERRYDVRSRPASLAPRTVPVSNPFYVDPIGTGQPIRVQYDFRRDLGPETMSGRVRAIGTSAGINKKIGAWALDIHATYGRQQERAVLGNAVNSARLNLALADTDPATAYNLFGDGASTNPATIDRVRGSSSSFYRYQLWSTTAKVDGPLVALPAGDLTVAVGGEYREENFAARSIADRSTLAPVERVSDLPGTRRIAAIFGELLVPVFGGDNRMAGLRRLDLSLAGRVEDYSDFGTTANPKLGLRWAPVDGVSLRGTFGRSFRAPSFADLQQGPANTLYFTFALPDPASPTGTTNALVLRGNDPGVGPERATTWTAGVDLEPRFASGLRLGLTWFAIRYRDRITDPSAELFNTLVNRATYAPLIDASPDPATIARYYADPSFQDLSGIPASAVTTIVDARVQNLSRVTQSGIDWDLGYRSALGTGTLDLGVAGTWLHRLSQRLTDSAPGIDILNTLGNPADLRFRARAGWSDGSLGVTGFLNHVGGYSNRTVAVPERVASWTTMDVQLSYQLVAPGIAGAGMRFALGVSNLFDRDPPYVNNFSGLTALGYDPENASAIGRVISLQVTRTW